MPNEGKKIRINDNRKVDNITGKSIKNLFTGNYDAEIIKDFIESAIEHDVDPYTAVTQALIETKVGSDYGRTSNIAAIDHLPESWQNKVKKEADTRRMSKGEHKLADTTKNFLNSVGELKQMLQEASVSPDVSSYLVGDKDRESLRKDIDAINSIQEHFWRMENGYSSPDAYFLKGVETLQKYSVHPSYKMLEEIASEGIDKAVKAYNKKHQPLEDKMRRAQEEFLMLSPGQQYVIAFKDKMDYAKRILGEGKPETAYLQFYQGWTKNSPEAQYGLPAGSDFTKIQPYGKRLVDVRDNVIKQNEEIKKMVEEAIKKKKAKNGDISFIDGYSSESDAFRSYLG